MTDIDTIRQRVLEHIHDGYTDKACFNNADIVWVEGYQEWILIATNPETMEQYWRGTENNAAKLLHYISDEDVRDFYNEILLEQYEGFESSDEETA